VLLISILKHVMLDTGHYLSLKPALAVAPELPDSEKYIIC